MQLVRFMFAALLTFSAPSLAFAAPPVPGAALQEGDHYQRVQPAQPTESGDKIEVLEIFWYGCPHCFDLEPGLNAWAKKLPSDVALRRMPGVLPEHWVPHAKAFYTLEAMGALPRLHEALFEAIHVEQMRLDDKSSLAQWAGKNGVDAQQFGRIFDSFAVQSKAMRAKRMTQAYGINGVPAIIVDGKYRTSVSMAGGERELFEVVNALIEMSRRQRQTTQ